MQIQKTGLDATETEIAGGEPPAGKTPPQEGTAVFAAYKKKGVPVLKENAAESGGRSKKLITAENIEEMTADNNLDGQTDGGREKTAKKPTKKTMANKKNTQGENEINWFSNEAQLTVNVYQTGDELVLQSAIAGIKVEDLDVLIEDDVISIKGNRANPQPEKGDYFIEECYWGPFVRKVILPVEVDSARADAAMKDGILTIRIPKIVHEKKKKVIVQKTA